MKIKIGDLVWSLNSSTRMKDSARPIYEDNYNGWTMSSLDVQYAPVFLTVKASVVKSELLKELFT